MIDRPHDKALGQAQVLSVFRQREDCRIVALDQGFEEVPYNRIGRRQINVTTPGPRARALVVLDQEKRLRIVHDDDVVLQLHAQRVLEKDLFVRSPLLLSDIDNTACRPL
jgi:hypothetical protein